MRFKKITLSDTFTIVLTLFTVTVLFSARAKTFVIMGLMMIGFFKPPIPQSKPGEKQEPAPAFVAQSIDGKVVDLQQQKGKVVFINFWATWCPPCLGELTAINTLYQKVKNDPNIVFLSVDVDNTLAKSAELLQNRGYQFPVYGGHLEGLPKSFFSGIIPTTIVIDKKGQILFNHTNRANYADDAFAKYVLGLAKE
jgi:thiol-disulfide isomerase/thioredoxin